MIFKYYNFKVLFNINNIIVYEILKKGFYSFIFYIFIWYGNLYYKVCRYVYVYMMYFIIM